MKRILFFLCLICFVVSSKAKEEKSPKAILDKTAQVIKSAGDIEVAFKATTFVDLKDNGSMNGTLYIRDKRLHLVSDNMMYWFDGTNLWTYVKANNEVNVSTPSLNEQQQMNPYLFTDMYKRGFNYKLTGSSNLRGKNCYVIKLTAQQSTQKIQEIILDIDKSTFHPVCIRMRLSNNKWNRISILSCKTNQNFSESLFKFDKTEFPGLEIIDLR